MARYTGPVCRLCRRYGEKLYLKGDRCFSPKCAFERRPIDFECVAVGIQQSDELIHVVQHDPRELLSKRLDVVLGRQRDIAHAKNGGAGKQRPGIHVAMPVTV